MKRNIFVVAAVLLNSTLQAQTDTGKVLSDVIVTANKFEQKQITTGKVVSIISKEQIEKSSGKTVAELLNDQVGITVNGSLNNLGTNQSVYMRGANYGRTLILIDGIPVTDPSDINNAFNLNLLSLNDVERIEICKGAQSTIYGSDAVAGVINIITTKNNVKSPLNVKASTIVGNFGTFKGNVQVYGKIFDKLSYTVRYSKLYTEGFSAAYDSTGNKNFDKDGYNGNVFNASLNYDVNKELSANAYYRNNNYKTSFDAGAFKDDIDRTSTNKNISAGGGFQLKKENFTLIGNYQYSQIARDLLNDTTDGGYYSYNKYYGKTQFVDIYAKINLGNGFSLLPGVSYNYASMNTSDNYGYGWTLSPNTSTNQKSVYASFLYSYKNFNVDFGGRFNNHSRYGDNYTFTFNPSYKLDDNHSVFGSISSAYKVPSLYQLFDSYSGNDSLKPERGINYEIGFQERYVKANSRIVGFYRQTQDVLDFDNNSNKYFNTKSQNVAGLEYEVSVKPFKGVTLTANYTYLNIIENTQDRSGTIINDTTTKFNDTTYKYALRRPTHTFNVTIGYSYKDKLYASVSGKYVSNRHDAGDYGTQDVLMPCYFILNGYAEYKWSEHYKIFTDLKNITNKKFFDVRGYNSIPFVFNSGILINW